MKGDTVMDELFERKVREYGISPLPKDTTVAMAYVPYQSTMGAMYSPEQGVECGTMFQVLDKPFYGGRKR